MSDVLFTKLFQLFLSIAAWLSSWSVIWLHSFGDIVQPFSVRSSLLVRALHSAEHLLVDPSTIVYSAYVSEQSQFPALGCLSVFA